ncbi:MAG TPA: site-2 protease family protein [Nostocaceae cyanobacterium]|nr:site-2 protease family protein [Nostocaceae cyanobacterium]
MSIFGNILIIAISIYAWLYFSIFSHEIGHFFVAKLLGLEPKLVKIGSGHKFLQTNLLDATFELMILPGGGITQITNLFVNQLKLKLILFYFAGSAVQLLSLSILIILYSRFIDNPLILIFCLFEVWTLFNNLIPTDVQLYGSQLANDGKIILETLFNKYPGNIQNIVDLSRYKIPEDNLSKGLFKSDVTALIKYFQALSATNKSNFELAIQLCNELLNQPNLLKSERVLILDHLISIVINHGEKKYLPLADNWSLEAMEIAKDCVTLRGTRGAILVELERFSEGKELLLPLTAEGNNPIDIFFSCCYVAKADFHLGNEDKIRDLLIKAQQTGLFEQYLLQLQKELNCFI